MRVGPTACGVPCDTGQRPRRPGVSRGVAGTGWRRDARAGAVASWPTRFRQALRVQSAKRVNVQPANLRTCNVSTCEPATCQRTNLQPCNAKIPGILLAESMFGSIHTRVGPWC